jgi:hypothetical protein
MHVLSVYDLDNKEAIQASMNMRRNSNRGKEPLETVREAVSIVGGRLSYLSRVSKSRDMLEMANHLKTVERGWLLSRIGLIQDCDDDVMDEVKILPAPTFVNIDTHISKNGVPVRGFSYKSLLSREKSKRTN